MPQVFNFPHCKTAMSLPDDSAGKAFRCPSCKNPFTVPAAAPALQTVGAGAASSSASSSASMPSLNLPSISSAEAAAKSAGGTPSACPACGSDLLPGAIACMDCGFLLQADTSQETDLAPNICTNPACGVANPPGERNCVRCGTPLPTAPGTMLHGRYRIERLIAMGGFGAVYLATDVKAKDRPVAIKDMICADPQEFAIRLNFFRREAEILRSLDIIPIVPRVYDLIEQGQSAHLVMEFIRGQDLLKLMESNGNKPFGVEQVIEWSKSICDVLQ